MMKKSFVLTLAVIIMAHGLALGNDKKYQRLVKKAEKAYENFVYYKAVDLYQKALEVKEEEVADVNLKIADSYRLMNKPRSAENWYAKVEGSGIMTDQDLLNYAQVLLKNGKDKRAKEVSSEIKALDISQYKRMESIENVSVYYTDSLAYFVENMNINTEESEFSPTYLDDGFAFVSNRKPKGLMQSSYGWDDTYFLDLYYAEVEDDQVREPEAMSKRINTIFHEGPASFFDDDQKVFFTRNNFNLGEERTSVEGVNMLKIYFTQKSKMGKWAKATSVPFNSDDYSVGHPSYDEKAQVLYFASDMPGGVGGSDIYKVSYIDGQWGQPENMGSKVNTIEDEVFPYIAEDNVLYFASAGHPGIGGLDVYEVDLSEDQLNIHNMGFPVNTPSDDFGMILRNKVGYLSSNREGGVGNDDIYKVHVYKYDINARLVDARSGEELAGSLVAVDKRDNGKLDEDLSEGKVSFTLFRGREVLFTGAKEGYETTSFDFSTTVIPLDANEYTVDVALNRLNLKAEVFIVSNPGEKTLFSNDQLLRFFDGSFSELEKDLSDKYYVVDTVYNVNPIYYDFDKHNIREDAQQTLSALVDLLNKYDFDVVLGAHTDSRGSNSYNDRLAARRVAAAEKYLIENGVSPERIIKKSYGEKEIVNDCLDGVDCDQDQHQLNRRTEVRLKVQEKE